MIDYNRIQRSLDFYQEREYSRVESPWLVPSYIDNLTRPEGILPMKIEGKDKHLVASGEQSLMSMIMSDGLPKGKYVTVTPCFRSEKYDHFHQKHFIKTELIVSCGSNNSDWILEKVLTDAEEFFESELKPHSIHLSRTSHLSKDDNEVVIDLEIKVRNHIIELGSYGVRSKNGYTWVFGTGCAEPRLTKAIEFHKSMRK